MIAASTGAVLVATFVLAGLDASLFEPYFGALDPRLAVAVVAAVGLVCLTLLRTRGWFEIFSERTRSGASWAAKLALTFGVLVILGDLLFRFPEDINAPLPAALAFYPVMGFVVEIVFHAAPLLVLLELGRRLGRIEPGGSRTWLCLVAVAFIEPAFQLLADVETGSPSARSAFVGVHVLAINLAQLALLQRFDFVSMVLMRLFYYAIWHVAWGHLRLGWLF